jgi:hypothetical protein
VLKVLKPVQLTDSTTDDDEPIDVSATSENVEDICKSVAYLGVDDIVTGGHTAIFKHKQNSKYLSYVLVYNIKRENKSTPYLIRQRNLGFGSAYVHSEK